MKFLVTAGPTREPVDPVRFISNPSSGKMGFAVAKEALRAGHEVTLITGPVALKPPAGAEAISVVTTRDMARAVRTSAAGADCIVMAAAVADYRPARPRRRKIKKDSEELTLTLVRNPDILKGLGRRKGNRVIIGFALETDSGERNARRKMREKNLDAVVLNSPETFEADRASATIFTDNGRTLHLRDVPKSRIAREIIKLAERRHNALSRKDRAT